MGLSEGRNKEYIGFLFGLLMLLMMQFLSNLGPQLTEEVVAVSSDALDSHEVDEGDVLSVGLLLLLEVLVDVGGDWREEGQ
jgi:hypothetical protein